MMQKMRQKKEDIIKAIYGYGKIEITNNTIENKNKCEDDQWRN